MFYVSEKLSFPSKSSLQCDVIQCLTRNILFLCNLECKSEEKEVLNN